ncbi:golgi-body localization protein domain-containing protein [Gymnopilus junonius]|uniref:Golgi-body localization protein domain-containing protein n=1 Tax=Gymnopilus junonius TaxID=109634 RepID=A0A9P5TVT8_GYMJU|nr:golgi-body localization protein domain-containing protein [Gymnopilus junonius]
MFFSVIYQPLRWLVALTSFLLLSTPDHTWTASIAVWIIRIVTFSLILRTYFLPWFLSLMSDHIRVRSISLRSIRGIYFRTGSRTWRVERVSYAVSSVDGSRHLRIKIDGASLHIANESEQAVVKYSHGHKRTLTLANLNPSPLAKQVWKVIWILTSIFEPYLRPLLRTYVIACLRLAIQRLPVLTQALSFEWTMITVTFAELPGAKIVVEEMILRTALALTHFEQISKPEQAIHQVRRRDTQPVYGMRIWKKRLAESFQRSLDKALGESRGTATLSLEIHNVLGTMPRPSQIGVPFLVSPGAISLGLSAKFNPKEGALEPNSLELSLSVGECSAKVDLLKNLLDNAIPKKSPSVSIVHPSSPPVSPYGDSPFLSSFALGSPQSTYFPSPAPSFASSLFSPSSLFAPSTVTSPKPSVLSPNSGHLLSPKSPSSPFLRAISASIRPRRRFLVQAPLRLKDFKDKSKISILQSVKVSMTSLNLSILPEVGSGPYRTSIKDIAFDVSLSDPSNNELHKTHLGSRAKADVHDSQAYALKATIGQITLERQSKDHVMRLAKMCLIRLQILAFQWPTPLLLRTPFIDNDPNGPLLAIHFKTGNLHVTERMSEFQRLLSRLSTTMKSEEVQVPPVSHMAMPPSLPVPRLSVAVECGSTVARLIYDADKGEKHRAIELRTNGFTVTSSAGYRQPSHGVARFFPAAGSVQPLQWNADFSLTLEPTLVRVRSKHDLIGAGEPIYHTSDEDFLDDPPLLSMGIVEIFSAANAVAQIDGAPASVAEVDFSTLLIDLSFVFDSFCIELWHPISVDAALRLLTLVPPRTKNLNASALPTQSSFSRLPSGLSARVSVARFVVFITAPDISPEDNLDLSRGFALRTAASFEYCCLRPNQDHWLDNPRRSQKRAKLGLPSETATDALVAAKAFALPEDKSAFLKVRFINFVFRAAVATQYEPDEPVIAGREDILDRSQEFLRVHEVQMDLCLASRTSANRTQPTDVCDVSIQVPLVRFDFQLAFVYSILLGLQTIRLITPPRAPVVASQTKQHQRNISMTMQGNITTIQGFLLLPTQQLVIRTDGLGGYVKSGETPRMKWTRTGVFVSLLGKVNTWEPCMEDRWDEFISFQSWEVSFTQVAGSLCVSVDGESAHVRIPHGFILADLVQDATVSVKAIKHMAHMASAGCYSNMPSPEPEGPKSVPHLTVRLRCLCLEAQDDPFETRLGLIWKTGAEAVKQRMEREEAFQVKVATVLSAEPELSSSAQTPEADPEADYQFDAKHSVSIKEARKRLDDVHALDWALRLERSRNRRSKEENAVLHKIYGTTVPLAPDPLLEFMNLSKGASGPPLLRIMLEDLCLTISPPSFSVEQLADVMHSIGSGLPRDTEFSLLIPLHVHFTLSSLLVTLRDYPLPLASIPAPSSSSPSISWTFDTDLIVAEEMGTEKSVDWITCPIIDGRQAHHGEAPFSIQVPKTIMPVKTYATATIKITTPEPTIFSWGVSYGPAIQDVMRIVETLSSAPRDFSPALGFWDKMRLILHWTVKVTFNGDVRLYIKGSRDPCEIHDSGAGFALCWQGNPEIRVGYENQQKELIQVMSEGMLIAVPDFSDGLPPHSNSSKPFKKICARLSSGVRYGVGFVLERTCGPECLFCTGAPFQRKCRFFSFRPHYEVKLEKKPSSPSFKALDDSYNGFRSDFIHLSVSLASSLKVKGQKLPSIPSSLHLTPKVFAHFWSWCALFDGALTLPIRQGNYHPTRPISPKFGRHLATLKYRISLPHLYFLHGYIDESRETWVDGVTPWVGLKGKVDELLVDMHQREEETTVLGPVPNTTRVVRKKPFYAAEVIMKGLELRAVLASFPEPMKLRAEMIAPPQRSNYRKHTDLPVTLPASVWHDMDDFVELDWSSEAQPILHLLPLASCPHFTFSKRNEALSGSLPQASKFGSEHSHMCLLGQEPSITKTQIALACARATELRKLTEKKPPSGSKVANSQSIMKMVTMLEDYIAVLKEAEIRPDFSQEQAAQTYHMPAEIMSSDEWIEFDNVYQIHCPSIFMDSAVRDIMVQYYYCSRDRRGFEYHMATRAVKFIRDQANGDLTSDRAEDNNSKDRIPPSTAQLAASALRKMLKGDNGTKVSLDLSRDKSAQTQGKVEPLDGWAEGVSLRKSHCCLLLKPQIVLRGETRADTCIVAAAQAKLQSFAIMDLLNLDDPVSGKVINYTSLSGLQAFAPTNVRAPIDADGPVPLEVLIDLRCESDVFERLVPQTEAIFHYDKFNRLRLRNNITSTITKPGTQNSNAMADSHLQDQTDLIRVHIPRFTVSANTEHFQAISNIVTKLLLFSDPAHKTRLDKLETLIFTYDFTDLASAARVVSNLQGRLRDALETERLVRRSQRHEDEEEARLGLIQLDADIFLLSEELNLLFDAIKMVQDRSDDQTDQKSALLLHASSSEISWRMLDARRNLLSKLVVTNINFHWLSRQDSSTVNSLTIGNLTAFDGSRYAIWAEILSKYDEPPNHPLAKRGLFLVANWIVLAPVGGITIYEAFELSFHPLRLQIDSKVGRRIMEYVWPDRKNRATLVDDFVDKESPPNAPLEITVHSPKSGRSSVDSPRGLRSPIRSQTTDPGDKLYGHGLRKLGASRSFTDLRSARTIRTNSTESVKFSSMLDAQSTPGPGSSFGIDTGASAVKAPDDAQVMKTRSSQKSFVLVRISSIHLLLSVIKEGSFECHDAKIKTRELEYRNQTWSFEELVNQFIPSNMNWRGWVKMAFHQPLVPQSAHDNPLRLLHPRHFSTNDDDHRLNWMQAEKSKKNMGGSSKSSWRAALRNNKDPPVLTALPLTAEPESIDTEPIGNSDSPPGRKRVKSLFGNKSSRRSKSRGPGKSEDDRREDI